MHIYTYIHQYIYIYIYIYIHTYIHMNSYTYMHDHKVLSGGPNETGINNCNCRSRDACPLQKSSNEMHSLSSLN